MITYLKTLVGQPLFVILVAAPVFIGACAKTGQKPAWPAQVTSFQGFTSDQQQTIQQAITQMNQQSGQTLVTQPQSGESSSQTGQSQNYPITIQLVAQTSWPSERAGFATVSDQNCLIQLSSQLFQPGMTDYIVPVVWHETGHCAGLVHVPQQGQVMYPITEDFDSYTQPELSTFFSSFIQSSGM